MLQRDCITTVPDTESGTVFYVPPVENLKLRARLKKLMRDFFDRHDFLEVETPVRIAGPAPEEYIDCIEASKNSCAHRRNWK